MRKYRCAYIGFLVDLNPKELVVEWVDHDKDIGKLCPEDGSTIVPPVLAPDDVHLIIPQMSDLNEELGALETFLEALPREHQANCETIAKKNPVRNCLGTCLVLAESQRRGNYHQTGLHKEIMYHGIKNCGFDKVTLTTARELGSVSEGSLQSCNAITHAIMVTHTCLRLQPTSVSGLVGI